MHYAMWCLKIFQMLIGFPCSAMLILHTSCVRPCAGRSAGRHMGRLGAGWAVGGKVRVFVLPCAPLGAVAAHHAFLALPPFHMLWPYVAGRSRFGHGSLLLAAPFPMPSDAVRSRCAHAKASRKNGKAANFYAHGGNFYGKAGRFRAEGQALPGGPMRRAQPS